MIDIEITGKGLNVFIPNDDIKYFNRRLNLGLAGKIFKKFNIVDYYWSYLFSCVSGKLNRNRKYDDKAVQLKLLGD